MSTITRTRTTLGVAATLGLVCICLAQETPKRSITFKEGEQLVPREGGDFDKYTYGKGAFYGYAYEGQAKPHWYNFVHECKRKKLSYRSPQMNEEGHIQGYDLANLHTRETFNERGVITWEILSKEKVTGTCYTGNHKDPVEALVDYLLVKSSTEDSHGALMLHLPPGSKYVYLPTEVADLLAEKSKQTPGVEVIQITAKTGEVVATLNTKSHTAVAGPKGMYVAADLLAGWLDLGQGLRFSIEANPHKKKSGDAIPVSPGGSSGNE
jgi:hypothetical protein